MFVQFKMAYSFNSGAKFLAALVLMSAYLVSVKAGIRAVNKCGYPITVFYLAQNFPTLSIPLGLGGLAELGVPNPWVGGVIWASQTGNRDNAQCTQLEFNIGSNGRDFYDISLVNAYNLPAMINPTSIVVGDVVSGLECGTVICSIANLETACVAPSVFGGPDGACINTLGPGLVNTPSIQAFRNLCPSVYVQSNNNANVVYGCNTGAQYDVIWCP